MPSINLYRESLYSYKYFNVILLISIFSPNTLIVSSLTDIISKLDNGKNNTSSSSNSVIFSKSKLEKKKSLFFSISFLLKPFTSNKTGIRLSFP